jgi:DNA-binding LytR/AlgR family response regulator
MNILICDDRPSDAAELERLLQNSKLQIQTVVFNDGYDALDYAAAGTEIDVCVLDIIMPGMDGIRLARELRQRGFSGEIVFLSTSREFAPESYEVKAFSYLIKPVTQENVKKIVEQLDNAHKAADTARILLKTPGVSKSVLLRDISYVEVIQHKVYFRLCNRRSGLGGEIVVNSALKDLSDTLLCDPRFVQCHRSFIVNMDEIAEISEWAIQMRRGERIPITRTYHDVRSRYYQWVFGNDRK